MISVAELPVPTLRPEYVLVRTIAVALNPTDWQTVDESLKEGTPYALLGCDAAGIVVQVGSKVTKEWKVGDRIAGGAHGGWYHSHIMMYVFNGKLGNDLNPARWNVRSVYFAERRYYITHPA